MRNITNMRKYTIFFSWQSDEPSARIIVENSIKTTISDINRKGKIQIEMDESTWNVPGMPKIEDAIKDKIEKCDVYIADLTPIEKTEKSGTKIHPNSNVLIELGYAMKVLGPERIILVAQKKWEWNIKDMPFDINHHRIITFKGKSEIDLQERIVEIIKHRKRFNKGLGIRKFFSLKHPAIIHNDNNDNIEEIRPHLFEDSSILFSQRIDFAFPGERGINWHTSIRDIKLHLRRLLHSPLVFTKEGGNGSVVPIWWFRSGASCGIECYRHLSRRRFLIGNDEWKISKIAVFHDGERYYNDYVYVEIDALRPTSLGQVQTKDLIPGEGEEYGLLSIGKFLKIKMTREEYDDGGCKRLGKVFNGPTQLRNRRLTRYNFLICAQAASYNSRAFDARSRTYMDGLLNGSVAFSDFHKFLMTFSKPS